MDATHWKSHIESVVDNNDDKAKLLLAKMLEESDKAKQLLRDKGYGWTGLSLLETVKQIKSI